MPTSWGVTKTQSPKTQTSDLRPQTSDPENSENSEPENSDPLKLKKYILNFKKEVKFIFRRVALWSRNVHRQQPQWGEMFIAVTSIKQCKTTNYLLWFINVASVKQ